MATATSLTRTLPAGALICRGCLRASRVHRSLLLGSTQSRWVGNKYLVKLRAADEDWANQAEQIKRGNLRNHFDELEERGYIKGLVGISKDEIREIMRVKRVKAYAGVDPTASSLHLGHLVTFMPLFWMYRWGYGAFTLVGASTAKIGDPTGRTEDRPERTSAENLQNLAAIHHQIKALWANLESDCVRRFGYQWEWAWTRGIINNNHWWNKQPMLEVLRRMGMSMRIGPLLGRDHVKNRVKDGSGMSVAEFFYPLMQAWDWWELLRQRGCQMQIGGSDQYGNILTGIECVKSSIKTEPNPANKLPNGKLDQPFGFTVPLLTDASGVKFGKSAGNAIWLDPFQTTPYEMYGYLVRRSDDEVDRLLKLLTFLPMEQIASVMTQHKKDPRKRVAQHLLAHEVLRFVHGKAIADNSQKEHKAMYGASSKPTKGADTPGAIGAVVAQKDNHYQTGPLPGPITANNRPRVDIQLPRALLGKSLARIMYASGLAVSSSDADRMIKAGGVYIGGRPGGMGERYQYGMLLEQLQFVVAKGWSIETQQVFLIEDKIMLLRKGKHNLRVIEFISDEEWQKLGIQYPGQETTGAFREAMGKLNKEVRELRAKKREAGGNLKEEDKMDDKPFAGDKPVSEKWHQEHRRMTQKAGKEGLVKDDPESW